MAERRVDIRYRPMKNPFEHRGFFLLVGVGVFLLAALFAAMNGIVDDGRGSREAHNSQGDEKETPYLKDTTIAFPDISASAAISFFVDEDGVRHGLFRKDANILLPIASVTKLMTALVAVEELDMSDVITMSRSALTVKGASGYYQTGDSLFLSDALHALLIASHNEVAAAIAQHVGEARFLERMNEKAGELGLRDTAFTNVTGLDPEPGSEAINRSSVSDIAALLQYIFEHNRDIFSILEKSEFALSGTAGAPIAVITSTNKLLTEKDTALRVLGGKTGETPRAKMNLAIISAAPSSGYVVSVVLGSQDSFGDMRRILGFINEQYVW